MGLKILGEGVWDSPSEGLTVERYDAISWEDDKDDFYNFFVEGEQQFYTMYDKQEGRYILPISDKLRGAIKIRLRNQVKSLGLNRFTLYQMPISFNTKTGCLTISKIARIAGKYTPDIYERIVLSEFIED